MRPSHGCRCQLCAYEGFYLDSGSGRCLECPSVGRGVALLAGLVLGPAALAGCFVALLPARRTIAWLACYARSIGVLPKFKILFCFYGIATVLDEVYDFTMPPAYTDWVVAAFGWVRIDWVSSRPSPTLA